MNIKAVWTFGALISLMGAIGLASVDPWWGLWAGLFWIATASFTGWGVLRGKKE